ncbi:Glycosyltransferase involved in cell wall bisynthesis [Paucidesulfovibrio gracilis DSM 16080]|uniref:Glycosyltransferase involved in cell wall bisynthesis n=1 Tax=Paucidesulfovibrio gracilis DSM 16080 TaxID=1121449 RepID=A0A1T4XUS2_9BACT|nr:glycosyltransferase [Paucidesulfovibrio gracilis]SKA93153.1 Glycosyltransferase involved in cell wall bisynthesis [Paucidesulfovibrio gracilis DSM 16080]
MLPPSIPIVCYHDISNAKGSLPPHRFLEHLDAMADAGWKTLTARELYDAVTGSRPVPRRSVVLTFDDGHVSNALFAAPELEQRGMTGVFFAVTDFIQPGPARTPDAAPQEKRMPDCFVEALTSQNYEQFINEGEIAQLLAAGHEVHSHGCRHQGCFRTMQPRAPLGRHGSHWASWSIYPQPRPGLPTFEVGSAYVYDGYWPNQDAVPRFTRRSPQERLAFCREDFARSLERMRELTGAQRQFFCWPWGNYDQESDQILRSVGYDGAFTLERGPNVRGTDPFRLHRIGVASGKDSDWLLSRLRMYGYRLSASVCFKKLRKRPEVQHVLLTTDSQKVSGGSRQMLNNAHALSSLGMRVSVCVPPDSQIARQLPPGVTLVPHTDFRNIGATARHLRGYCRKQNVDVVHTFHNKTYKPALLARAMNVLTTGRPGFRLFINRGVIFSANVLFGLWARLANGMIVNSRACADSLRRLRVPEKRLNVVYNGLDFSARPMPRPEERKKRGLRVVYLGNNHPAKGLDVFLQAVDRYAQTYDCRDMEFVVIGSPGKNSAWDVLSPEARKRIHHAGILPHEQVQEQLAHADILVLTSRQESMPNVLLEGFFAGLPVVGTRVGGIPELIRDRVNGLLCESEDAVCVAEKIRYLAERHSERLRMGLQNQELVEAHFTVRAKGVKLLQVYHGRHVRDRLALPDAES